MHAALELHSCSALAVGTAVGLGAAGPIVCFQPGVGAHHTGDELNLSQRLLLA